MSDKKRGSARIITWAHAYGLDEHIPEEYSPDQDTIIFYTDKPHKDPAVITCRQIPIDVGYSDYVIAEFFRGAIEYYEDL